VIDITQEHPDYAVRKPVYQRYRDLYSGGEEFHSRITDYLAPKQKEPSEVYRERLRRAYYENYLGSIIDWYAATLFRTEAMVTVAGHNEAGRRFFSEFADDCDRQSTGLTDFFRGRFIEALIQGRSFILADFPRMDDPAAGRPRNRAEEEAAGVARAYLTGYGIEDVINWSVDAQGQYDWVVLRVAATNTRPTRWLYYDREKFRLYQAGEKSGAPSLIDEGLHGMSKLRRVPLFDLKLSEGLWITNKTAALQIEHFNKSNALSWALTMGLLAMPVVYTDREFNQIVGESFYIQLGPNDRFGWTEPEGRVFQIAAENLDRLKQEIYRVSYLLNQAGSSSSVQSQSGLSKMRDFAVTQEVLRAYGDSVKDTMNRVLSAIEAAREDGLRVHVSGLDEFDIVDFSTELADAERLLALETGSPTLRKQILKKLSLKFLSDVRQEIKDQISGEIDAAA
jgi:hypothetical protein